MGNQAVKGTESNGADRKGSPDFNIYPEALHIEADPSHPLYDPRSVIPVTEGIVESLARGHQTHDVVVWRDGDLLRVIDGHQTTHAALVLNRRTGDRRKIRITLRDFASTDEAVIFAMAANKHVKSPPSVMAKEIIRMRAAGIKDEAICVHFGLSKLQTHVLLAKAGPEVADAVDSGRVSVRQASKLAALPLDEQADQLAEVVAGRRIKDREVTAYGRPSSRLWDKLCALAENLPGGVTGDATALFRFGAGKITFDQMLSAFPALAAVVNAPAGEACSGETDDAEQAADDVAMEQFEERSYGRD